MFTNHLFSIGPNFTFDPMLNLTEIILLPKKNEANRVNDYRPISLCNVSMKIITKVLANRLSESLPMVISQTQSAFIKGRLISDNIILAHETNHYLKHRKNWKGGFLSIKIDMSKAYDRVEWPFLKEMLLRLWYNGVWVQKVMTCVESVRYRVKVNGMQSETITPTRGLRQGDPLSPYLFLICQKRLLVNFAVLQQEKKIEGIRLAVGHQRLNHLLFADDCMIFIKSELRQLRDL